MKDLKEFEKHIRSPMNLWVEECHDEHFATRFRTSRVLFSGKSAFQHIDVVETTGQGRMLLNDGIVMLSERDEAVYHEMLVHVPLLTHPHPGRVLIVGGGDGGTLREVLRHKGITRAVNVEIDKMVVDVCKKYFPALAGAFQDPRAELCIQDGADFVKKTNERYDVVLVDSTDPLGPAKVLFSEAFYRQVDRVLTKEGILVAQAESPLFKREFMAQKFVLQALKSVFPVTALYNYSNISYPGGLWSFAFASKKYHPVHDFQKNKLDMISKWNLHYYNQDIHSAAFAQPEFVKKELGHLIG